VRQCLHFVNDTLRSISGLDCQPKSVSNTAEEQGLHISQKQTCHTYLNYLSAYTFHGCQYLTNM